MSAAAVSRRDEISPNLPADLRALMGISLNDADCKRFQRNVATGLLEITLRGGDDSIGLFDLDMRYENASLVSRNNGIAVLLSRSREDIIAGIGIERITRTARRAIRRDGGIRAQLLYHEVDIASNGLCEHRMLLWPYGEILIRFTDFSLTRTLVASWDAP